MPLFNREKMDQKLKCQEVEEDGLTKLYCKLVIESDDGTIVKELASGVFILDEHGRPRAQQIEGVVSILPEFERQVAQHIRLKKE